MSSQIGQSRPEHFAEASDLFRSSRAVRCRSSIGGLFSWQLLALGLSVLPSCSDPDGTVATPYLPGVMVVVGEVEGGELTTIGACQQRDCEAFEDHCSATDAADVIVGPDGDVVDVLCYRQRVNVQEIRTEAVSSARAGDNTVLVFDGFIDGVDVDGDLTMDGEAATVYGQGPSLSIVGGTLEVEEAGAIVRGIRIQEDVTISQDDVKLTFCAIDGDLTITGDNVTVAVCDLFGEVRVLGDGAILVDNRTQQAPIVTGADALCDQIQAFSDENDDFRVQADEVGNDFSCLDEDD